jgi:hypothetical protein
LALFGIGGQGHYDQKHRDQLYQHYFAEIMREAHDPRTLEGVAGRVLYHPEVASDSTLTAMLRACIDERRTEIEQRMARMLADEDLSDPSVVSFRVTRSEVHDPKDEHDQVVARFERIRRDFDDRLHHHDLKSARDLLPRAEAMHTHYPDVIKPTCIERLKADLAQAEGCVDRVDKRIEQISEAALGAARRGEHKLAAELLRELNDIHRAYPNVLTDVRLRRLRDSAQAAEAEHEHSEAGRALLARERTIAADIKRWTESLSMFAATAEQFAPGSEPYRAAHCDAVQALAEIDAHDQDWLAELTVELDELREETHDASGQTDIMLDRFLGRLEAALAQLQERASAMRRQFPAAFPAEK